MNLDVIKDARDDLVSTLSDTGYAVHGYDVPKVVAGAIVLDEADPFLQYGDVFGTFKINFNVLLFQDTRNMATSTKAMDHMVVAAVWNLGEWTLTGLESHSLTRLQEAGPVFLVSRLSVQNLIQMGD